MKMPALANLYAQSVLSGQRKIEDVPLKIRNEVQNILDELEKATSTDE